MRPSDSQQTVEAVCDLRAALAMVAGGEIRHGYTPDAAAAEFAAGFAGPPARGLRRDEPVLIYPQTDGPALCMGAYGSEERVRNWLPGLPARIAPDSLSGLSPLPPTQTSGGGLHSLTLDDLSQLPVPQVTPRDAGRYITMGFILADAGDAGVALSAHRMLVLDHERLGVWMLPSRKLRALAAAAHEAGRSLPVSVNIGVPPAIAIASATSTVHLPPEWSKLSLAGALAGAPIELSPGAIGGVSRLSRAEIVLEGEILPETAPEALPGAPLAGSMPEFLGYDGGGQAELAVLHIGHIATRPAALFQAVVGPGREQSTILGLGGALTLALGLGQGDDTAGGAMIRDLRFSHAGGGMLLLFVALRHGHGADLAALAGRLVGLFPFAKTVVFVDEDVDLRSDEDVLWAMTTRAQLASDCHAIPDQKPLAMDPSQSPEWIAHKGTTVFKSYVDATVPDELRSMFRRAFTPAGAAARSGP